MSLRDTFLNMLGAETQEVQKTSNSLVRGARDFLKYGNRDKLYPTWSDVKMSDRDLYRGYSYAVIQKRGNKVASLAKENLKTWAKPEVLDEFQKKNEQVVHPYLTLIENSTEFTEKQFWKNISIYLDLAGRYYLGVLRTEVRPLNPNLPIITTDPTKFIMLNPYEIRRVVDKDGNVAGYIERKKDGRYREWALHQIIEMRELNPFDPEESQWAMTEAAKDAVYTINQSADYTRHSLDGNVSAPGIITTDVILQDEDFENFRARVTQHTKGEPLFGNGAGAIKWESMQVDLDKAALLDINEINRTTLFAVSGTSKTSLGIEQSGTTRETARVQSEQFVSDTAQPRLEDIIDFLNLDYKKHYNREYKKTGYYIEVQSAVGRDYENETKATAMRQTQLDLALSLIQAGYTQESAYQYATGDIELADLELEKGLDKPNIGQQGMGGDMGGMMGGNGNLGGGDGGGEPFDPDDFGIPDDDEEIEEDTEDEEEKDGKQDNSADLNGLNPHEDLVKSDFFAPASKVDEVHTCAGEHECTCANQVNVQDYFDEVGNEKASKAKEAYSQLEKAILAVEKEAIDISQNSVTMNAFSISDFLNDKQKALLIKKLKNALMDYWWVVFPMFAENSMSKRNSEFDTNEMFVFNNELQSDVELNAGRVAEGHINTIMNDVVDAVNRASTKATEEEAAKLIVDAYDNNPEKWSEWFTQKPDVDVAMRAILKTDILDENRRIYERALELAGQHYTAEQIAKTIREEFDNISKRRAGVIARNETMRAYAWSQYDSDLQFLNSIGKLEQAYKVLYSRRPPNEEDKICPFCRTLIEETNANPIPFEQPFIAFGESMQAYDEVGTLRMFTATYEDIQGGVIHPNCACEYKLVFKNASGEFVKTLNGVGNDTSENNRTGNDNSSDDDSSNNGAEQTTTLNGGKGSGFHGHYGRPGEVGGSASTKTVLGATPHYDGEKLTFENTQSVKQFRQLKDGTDKWTPKEIDIASCYFGSLYDIVNRIVMGKETGYSDKTNQSMQNVIDLLDERIEKSSLSEDVMLYMGSSIYHYIEDNQLPQVGDTVSYGGFNSTSLDPYESMGWGIDKKLPTDPDRQGALIFAIKAKKGAKGIKRFNEVEREVLLPRNAQLKITGRHLARDVFAGEGHNTIDKLYVLECEYE